MTIAGFSRAASNLLDTTIVMRRSKWWAALWLVAACGNDRELLGGDGPVHPACERHDCSNVVDRVVIPMLADANLAVEIEDARVLCRRMSIDLTGLAPTPDEVESRCVGKTPGAMADYFMTKGSNSVAVDGSSPYVFINRRWWDSQFSYDAWLHLDHGFFFHVRELDQLVGELYSGNIAYDEFAIRALASPAFVQRFGNFYNDRQSLPELAEQAFRVFLGREALAAEARNFGNLYRGWSTYSMDSAETKSIYPECPTVPGAECEHWELGLRGENCAGVAKSTCQSSVLGVAEMIPSTSGFTRYHLLNETDREAIKTPGKLIVARPEFGEAAANHALRKYLGWWGAGVYRPDFEVPAVRRALAQKLLADGYDIRKLEKEIVTSVLYTMPQTRTSGTNVPLWAHGPTKLMSAFEWYENVTEALGIGVDRNVWDFRYKNSTQFLDHFTKLPGQSSSDGFGDRLRDLGNDGGLVALLERRGYLDDLCPNHALRGQATLDEMLDRNFEGIGRPITDGERAILTSKLAAAATTETCANFQGCTPIALAVCRSLFASALFTFY